MSKRDRVRKHPRSRAPKPVNPMILVLTEGKVTEPEYINGLKSCVRNPLVRVVVVEEAGASMAVVRNALALKENAETRARRESDHNLKYDQVWCVFDFDEHPRINEAQKLADNNGIKLAVSNPCFELWLWLHFAEPPGKEVSSRLQKRLRKYIPRFDKHVDFEMCQDGLKYAIQRAKRLDAAADAARDPGRNPTTGMWRLVESIQRET